MIASLKGKVQHTSQEGLVLDVGGVGYALGMSSRSLNQMGPVGSEAFAFVYTHVAAEALRLYGFAQQAERAVFEVLIATSGVGPRLALAILSAFAPPQLVEVVLSGDARALQQIPGVGAKKAARLLLELKERLAALGSLGQTPSPGIWLPDVISALVNVGFAEEMARSVAKEVLEAHPEEQDIAALLKIALQQAAKRSKGRGSKAS